MLIDAICVRKFKKTPDGKIVKSRLCAPGCHDPFKNRMATKSLTATRLSQRLILTAALCKPEDDVECWDIAGAFLKCLTYKQLWKVLRELGINSTERLAAVKLPANVWRHLGKYDKAFNIPESEIDGHVLLCLKLVFGLMDLQKLLWHGCYVFTKFSKNWVGNSQLLTNATGSGLARRRVKTPSHGQ